MQPVSGISCIGGVAGPWPRGDGPGPRRAGRRRRPRRQGGRRRSLRPIGVASLLSDADGAVHTASPGDATSADLDSAVVDAVIDALGGTGKPLPCRLVASGSTGRTPPSPRTLLQRAGAGVMESEPGRAPCARRTWRARVVIVSSVAYGDGGGRGSRSPAGLTARWCRQLDHDRFGTTALVDGARRRRADVFRRGPGGRLGPRSLRRRRWTEPDRGELTGGRAAVAVGAPGAVPGPTMRSPSAPGRLLRRGPVTRSGRSMPWARAELGWRPNHPGPVEEFRGGSYRN